MRASPKTRTLVAALGALAWTEACGSNSSSAPPNEMTTGVTTTSSYDATTTSSSSSSDSTTGTTGAINSSGGASSTGGAAPSTGGSSPSGSGGTIAGSGGAGSGGTEASCPGEELPFTGPGLTCGESSELLLDAGPHQNRVNYAILGDGYTETQLDGPFMDHVKNVLDHEQGMFGELGEPYIRYRNFINLCAIKVASQDDCVDDLDTGLECDTPFDGYGDDASRLGIVSTSKVQNAVAAHVPQTIDIDWVAVTINAGPDNWWASGGSIMVWNGGYENTGYTASVALHEGGHTFHGLADEYASGSTDCSYAPEINVSLDNTGAKWADWLGFDHTPGTGLHGSYEGARYCDTGVYRPTENSEMNQLPDYFNMPSIEKMVLDIYDIVSPIDAHTPNDSQLVDPMALQVRVVDPEVILVDWSVDGELVEEDGGSCFDTTTLSSGEHTVTARAYDPTPWVRAERNNLEQSVSFDVSIGP